MVEDDIVIDGAAYAFDKTGAMITGWGQITDEEDDLTIWVYADKSGKLVKDGWNKIDGKWYFFGQSDDKSGPILRARWSGTNMRTGWIKSHGKWYHLAKSGAMQTGWQKIGGKWYYFESSGAMKTGWLKLSGKWYWFNSNGVMAANESVTISGKIYEFDANGVCLNP